MNNLRREPTEGGSITDPESASNPPPSNSPPDTPAFHTLELHAALQRALRDLGFSHCTPIQALTLPIAMQGRDVAGQAQTGTGKTAAYLLALMQRLLQTEVSRRSGQCLPRALIIAPTRELAVQIKNDAVALGRHTGLNLGLVYGGMDYERQQQQFTADLDVLIGTPGRLIDFHRRNLYRLTRAEALVLDEADRMFDLGFIRDVRYLLRRMSPPEQRLGMLFSATLPWKAVELAYEHMNDPELLRVNPGQITVEEVHQSLYHVSNEEKPALLIGLLRKLQPERSLAFVNTRHGAERIGNMLEDAGFSAGVLSGDVPQRRRLRLLEDFMGGSLKILVSTDVAARGLHIPGISHVFNYDLPLSAEQYIHRIGRTARAGARGAAVSLACEEFVYSLPEIESLIDYKIPVESTDPELMITPPPFRRRSRPHRPSSRRPGNRGPRRRAR